MRFSLVFLIFCKECEDIIFRNRVWETGSLVYNIFDVDLRFLLNDSWFNATTTAYTCSQPEQNIMILFAARQKKEDGTGCGLIQKIKCYRLQPDRNVYVITIAPPSESRELEDVTWPNSNKVTQTEEN